MLNFAKLGWIVVAGGLGLLIAEVEPAAVIMVVVGAGLVIASRD